MTKEPFHKAILSNQQTLNQNGEYYNPHAILGLHSDYKGQKVIRIWSPGTEELFLQVFGKLVSARRMDEKGLFEYCVPLHTEPNDYRIYHKSGLIAQDPYAFYPTIGELDQYLFGKGTHYQIYKILGAHPTTHQGVQGVRFAVWAPAARNVALLGDFNHWDGRINPMRTMGQSGIWELFVPGLNEGEKYKFEIKSQTGEIFIKADPYAFYSQLRPETASIVFDVERFKWSDDKWLEKRASSNPITAPLTIYELHLGSWKQQEGHFLNYRQIAKELASYCKEMGFTHVELMPIQEHPLDESWGYQISGFYSVTSRFGTPTDFQWFVNHLHENEIGVILDWVPGHFPTDNFSLGRFDGTALYEHEDPKKGYHPHWSTFIFNFGRHEVSNFLIANALYWLRNMHVDGLRVDAVASMLYLDYGREEGQWIPNQFGGKENLEAIEFFKHLNSIVHEQFPGSLMIAEESTSFTGVSHPVSQGGLGFDMKWNMGWMNDTLRYFSKDMFFRNHHHDDLTFGLLYAFSEKFALVLSHDEVVHGKKSLLAKMPGDMWQKFANLRLLFSYMICQPGKKLLFMGGEIAQWNEWHCKSELEWFLLHFPTHQGIQRLVKELNHFYLQHSALWERDSDYTGFEWVDFSDRKNSVISYLRKSSNERLLCVHNFTPTYYPHYLIHIPDVTFLQELFNSDAEKFGGSDKKNSHPQIIRNEQGYSQAIKIELAPLATMIFQLDV